MEIWDYDEQHEQESNHFSKTMGYLSQAAALDVVANYDSSQSKRIVDMGGSQGMLLTKLLQASPNVEGVLFDRPNVISQARSIIDSLGMEDRVTLVSGDFFQEVPSGENLYLLKQILHDWDDAQCLTILKNIRRAANSQSKFLVVEMLVPDEPEPSLVPLTNLNDAGSAGRPRAERTGLCIDAGTRRLSAGTHHHHRWTVQRARSRS